MKTGWTLQGCGPATHSRKMAVTVSSKTENKKTDAQEYTHTVGTHTHLHVIYTKSLGCNAYLIGINHRSQEVGS